MSIVMIMMLKTAPKPSTIYVSKVEDIQPLKNTLEAIVVNQYEIKVMRADEIKIQPKNIESYRFVKKAQEEKNTILILFGQNSKEHKMSF